MKYGGHILALDLATVTGWASGAPGSTPRSGSIRFGDPGASHAERFYALFSWLKDETSVDRPDLIVMEAPLNRQASLRNRNSQEQVMLSYGWPAVVQVVAHGKGIYDIRTVSANDVRRHFIGTASLKRNEVKRAVMQRCRVLGWTAKDDNAADALALWDYTAAMLNAAHGAETAFG